MRNLSIKIFLKNSDLRNISKKLILSNIGEGIIFNKDYTKGILLRGYSKIVLKN